MTRTIIGLLVRVLKPSVRWRSVGMQAHDVTDVAFNQNNVFFFNSGYYRLIIVLMPRRHRNQWRITD
jgi:hypothetical protein